MRPARCYGYDEAAFEVACTEPIAHTAACYAEHARHFGRVAVDAIDLIDRLVAYNAGDLHLAREAARQATWAARIAGTFARLALRATGYPLTQDGTAGGR